MQLLMENTKFALRAEPEFPLGPVPLYRLVARRDIGSDVKAGDLGGLVSGPACLAEDGDCWVYPGALVYAGGLVQENATARAGAQVCGAALSGNSKIGGDVKFVGRLGLGGDEIIEAREALIVNVVLGRMGQFMLDGQSIFVLEFGLADGMSSSFTLPAERCTDSLRAHLACRQGGDRVAFMRLGTGAAEFLQTDKEGLVSFKSIDQKITQMQAF